jgi:membrane peptidoglycan carboxypeptidase
VSPLEVAQVYAALANGGVAHPPIAVDRVVDQSGGTVWQPAPAEQPALDPNAAFLVSSVLSDPLYRPMLRDAGPDSSTVAAHTAFSDNHYDSWAAGYDSNLVLVVWIGNASGFALKDSVVASTIWEDIFRDALATHPAVPFDQPPDVVSVDLCANPGCTVKRTEFVIRGTEAIAQAANLATITHPITVISDSRTPLVNRGKIAPATASVNPSVTVGGSRSALGQVTVPDVSRTSPDQARQRLATAGLTNATKVQYIAVADLPANLKDLAVGQVAQTVPASGVQVQPGTSVVLVVRPN